MQKILFFLLFLGIGEAYCQIDFKNDKQRSTIRFTTTVPILNIDAQYEYNAYGAFTIVPKASFSVISFLKSGLGGPTDSKIQAQYGILARTELRYFYSLNRREKRRKVTRNFSGWYLGLEPFVLTNSIAASNTSLAKKNGSKGVFLNLGFQKQTGKHLYGAFYIGYAPSISSLSKIESTEPYSNTRPSAWIGLSIGYVL